MLSMFQSFSRASVCISGWGVVCVRVRGGPHIYVRAHECVCVCGCGCGCLSVCV